MFILILRLTGVIETWYTAYFKGYFYPKASMIFLAFLFVGTGAMLFSDYKTERISRGEDISKLSGLKLLTARRWIILIVGSAAGFANFALLYFSDDELFLRIELIKI